MRFFKIEGLGDQRQLNHNIVITKKPKLGLKSFHISKGRPVADFYPADSSIQLQDDCPGLSLTSYLSNTVTLLFFDTQCKEIIEGVCAEQNIEYLPFTLLDHNGDILSSDYWIINPIGSVDCLDRDSSEISYMDDDPSKEILSVKSFSFNTESLQNAPHIFRVPEQPYEYFIDEVLGAALSRIKPSNLMVTEILNQG